MGACPHTLSRVVTGYAALAFSMWFGNHGFFG